MLRALLMETVVNDQGYPQAYRAVILERETMDDAISVADIIEGDMVYWTCFGLAAYALDIFKTGPVEYVCEPWGKSWRKPDCLAVADAAESIMYANQACIWPKHLDSDFFATTG